MPAGQPAVRRPFIARARLLQLQGNRNHPSCDRAMTPKRSALLIYLATAPVAAQSLGDAPQIFLDEPRVETKAVAAAPPPPDRASVVRLYHTRFLPAEVTTSGWAGQRRQLHAGHDVERLQAVGARPDQQLPRLRRPAGRRTVHRCQGLRQPAGGADDERQQRAQPLAADELEVLHGRGKECRVLLEPRARRVRLRRDRPLHGRPRHRQRCRRPSALAAVSTAGERRDRRHSEWLFPVGERTLGRRTAWHPDPRRPTAWSPGRRAVTCRGTRFPRLPTAGRSPIPIAILRRHQRHGERAPRAISRSPRKRSPPATATRRWCSSPPA